MLSRSIRNATPHLLIIFEDISLNIMFGGISPILTWSQPVPNTVYELQVYTWNWLTAQSLLDAYLRKTKSRHVPLCLGEFDAFYAGSAAQLAKVDPNWQADTTSLFDYCKSNEISWSFLSYTSLGTNVTTPEPKMQVLTVLLESI